MMNAKTFPYLEVSGSYRDIGHAIGEMFRKQIQKIILERKRSIPTYDQLLSQCQNYFEIVLREFPQYIDEITGIAQASGIEVADYFLANAEELYGAEETREAMEGKSDHCTITVSFGSEGPVIGHNEDWLIENINDYYILKATINNVSFLSLTGVTTLPGAAASCNSFGLAQCINDVPQRSSVGIPKNFLARAILEAKTLEEAKTIIQKKPRASGYNHVLVQGNDIQDVELTNNDFFIQSLHHAPYVHTNHYLSDHMKKYEIDRSPSSVARFERASTLIHNGFTVDEMKSLLRDTSNTQYPICRSNATVASVIITPKKRTMLVCYGHPCAGEYTSYTL